jgi:hypothetical protein
VWPRLTRLNQVGYQSGVAEESIYEGEAAVCIELQGLERKDRSISTEYEEKRRDEMQRQK